MKFGKKSTIALLSVGLASSLILGTLKHSASLKAQETTISSEVAVEQGSETLPYLTSGITAASLAQDVTRVDVTKSSTYAQWSDPTLGDMPSDTSKIKEVSTWTEFYNAVMDTTTTYIKLMADIDTNLDTETLRDIPASKPSFVIDGNGKKLHTQGNNFWFRGADGGKPKGIYIKNITMYNRIAYGVFCTQLRANSYIVYDNVTYEGAQLTASYKAQLVFKGTNKITSAYKTYEVDINGTKREIENRFYTTVCSGLEAHQAIFLDGSDTTFDAGMGDALLIGGYTARATGEKSYAYIGDNAKLTVKATGNGGESYAYSASNVAGDGVLGDANYAGALVYAGATISNGGSVIVGENSEMTVDVRGTRRAGMRLTGGTAETIDSATGQVKSGANTTIELAKSAKLTVLVDPKVINAHDPDNESASNISTDPLDGMGGPQTGQGAVVEAAYKKYAGISLEPYSQIILKDEEAVIDVLMKNEQYTGTAINNRLTYSPGIRMNHHSSIYVASKANLKLNMNGSYGSALSMVGADSEFLVEEEGEVTFNAINQEAATSDLLQVDNGLFKIGRKGIFDMKVEDGSAARNMFQVGSGSFTFADAKRVDLDARGNTKVTLVNMNGTFNADIQEVRQWNKSDNNTAAGDLSFNHKWDPIYNAKITYSGSTQTAVSAGSSEVNISSDFIANYNTTNSNRTLYLWIEDVTVSVNEVSDNPDHKAQITTSVDSSGNPVGTKEIETGKVVTGLTLPDAYVTVKLKQKANPSAGYQDITPTTAASDGAGGVIKKRNGDDLYYHVRADGNGYFEFELKDANGDQIELHVDDEIQIYSWRSGKEWESTRPVNDRTAPEADPVTYHMVENTAATTSDVPDSKVFVDAATVTDKGYDGPPLAEANWSTSYNIVNTINDMVDKIKVANTPSNPEYPVTVDISDKPLHWSTNPAYDAVAHAKNASDRESDPSIPEYDVAQYIRETTVTEPNIREVSAELIVHNKATDISADSPMQVPYVDIRNLTEAQLKQYILDNATNLDAYAIKDGVLTDLTSKIQVKDLGGLQNTNSLVPNTYYDVVIYVPAADNPSSSVDIEYTIQVEVINMQAVLTVEFVDEADNVMSGYTLTINKNGSDDLFVGDVLNLTGIQSITDQIAALETAGYKVVTPPTDETAYTITNTAQTAQYKVTGQLFLQSAPDNIDFGELTYDAKIQRKDAPTLDKNLVVADTRANKTTGWTLQAKVTDDMTNTTSGGKLVDALRYVTDVSGAKQEIKLTAGLLPVHKSNNGGSLDVSGTWGTTSDDLGLKLVVDPSLSQIETGVYQGEITWQISAGTP